MYSTLEELEDNVVVSKAQSFAKLLWENKEVSYNERIKALKKYGKSGDECSAQIYVFKNLGEEMETLFQIMLETFGEMEDEVDYQIYYEYNQYEKVDIFEIFLELLNYRRVKAGKEELPSFGFFNREFCGDQLTEDEKEMLEKFLLCGYSTFYRD